MGKSIPAFIACLMLGCAASICNAQPPHNSKKNSSVCGPDKLEEKVKNAVVVLYGQMDDSSIRMFCTGTIFERNDNKYRIVTAAHCVSDDDLVRGKTAAIPVRWFITFENPNDHGFLEVQLVGAGYQSNGDDLAVIELETDKDLPVIPIADSDPVLGEDFVNIASPMGLGKQLFYGQISKERLELPIISGTINWRNNVLVQTQSGPGSSGSSIVSRCSGKIIGILVGSIAYPGRGTPNVVVVPISRFNKFYSEIKSGNYKYFDKDQASTNSFWAGQASRQRIYTLRDRAFYGLMYDMYSGIESLSQKKE